MNQRYSADYRITARACAVREIISAYMKME